MNKPLVSVVMVVCNVDQFLAESIESILHQTFTEFDFIIVDYGSTDSSKSVVQRYAKRDLRIRFHEIPHCGLGDARNVACSLARGRYVALMDADDVAVPERLQLEYEFMEGHPTVGLLGGAVQWINRAGQDIFVGLVPTDDQEIRLAMAVHNPFWQPTVLLRREALVRSGGYRDAFAPAEDYDLWMRVSEHFDCANLGKVVLRYRMHPQQVSVRKKKQQVLGMLAAQRSAAIRRTGQTDPFDTIREITSDLLVEYGADQAAQEKALISEYRLWIRHMILAGEASAALDAAVEVLSNDLAQAEAWQIADLYLTVSSLRWKRGEVIESIRSAAHALRIRPKLLGRPLRPWLRKAGLTRVEPFQP